MITKEMFGGHMLITKDMPDANGPLDRFMDLIPTHSLRYPGGTVTEALSMKDGSWDKILCNPAEVGSEGRVVTVGEAFAFAQSHDANINFVLPTINFMKDGALGEREPDTAAIDKMMGDVFDMLSGNYGAVNISSFEIGNEYWTEGGTKMTAGEYGRIADCIAIKLQGVIDQFLSANVGDNVIEPKIAVQDGAWWKTTSDETQLILNEIGPEARAAIDTVISHHYPDSYDLAEHDALFYEHINQFREAEGLEHVSVHISEWNVSGGSNNFGMVQPSAMLAIFDQMVKEDVSSANVWGTQYKFLAQRLTGVSENAGEGVLAKDIDVWLTPAGELYRSLGRNLVGTEMLDLSLTEIAETCSTSELNIHSYGNEDKTVIYLASRSESKESIDLSIKALMEKFPEGHIYATLMSAQDIPSTRVDEADPYSVRARSETKFYGAESLNDKNGSFEIPPFGLIQIVISKKGEGVRIDGQDVVIDPNDNLGEVIVGGRGNDTISGNFGDDTLSGDSGDDILFGGQAHDFLYGGIGSDSLHGSTGNDYLDGGLGADVMVGGEGSDTYLVDNARDKINEDEGFSGVDVVRAKVSYSLVDGYVENLVLVGSNNSRGIGNKLNNDIHGNDGNNFLNGGAGSDTLWGHDGNDTLTGGRGPDRMIGGLGSDVYKVDNLGDRVIERGGWLGHDTVMAKVDFSILGMHVEDLKLTGRADIDGIGNVLDNLIKGNKGSNSLFGGKGDDTLIGGGGDDVLNGGVGSDLLNGGPGSDIYIVNSIGDVVIEEERWDGYDKILSRVSFSLTDTHVEGLTLTGKSKINAVGNDLDNIIVGNNNGNVITGGDGSDTLTGLGGSDTFVLDVDSHGDVDRITDFLSGIDKLDISSVLLGRTQQKGEFNQQYFFEGHTAKDVDHHFLYDQNTGQLWFDEDGSGGKEKILLAMLENHADLSYADLTWL